MVDIVNLSQELARRLEDMITLQCQEDKEETPLQPPARKKCWEKFNVLSKFARTPVVQQEGDLVAELQGSERKSVC